jgi:hypothetical protein
LFVAFVPHECYSFIDHFFVLFTTFFSFFGGGGGMEEEEERIIKGDDVIVELDASLEDLYMGGSLKVTKFVSLIYQEDTSKLGITNYLIDTAPSYYITQSLYLIA